MKDNVSQLYQALKTNGFEGMGNDEKVFRDKLADPANRAKLYQALKTNGFEGMGSDVTFATKIAECYKADPSPKETEILKNKTVFGVPYRTFKALPFEAQRHYADKATKERERAAAEKELARQQEAINEGFVDSGSRMKADADRLRKKDDRSLWQKLLVPSSAIEKANHDIVTARHADEREALSAAAFKLDDARSLMETSAAPEKRTASSNAKDLISATAKTLFNPRSWVAGIDASNAKVLHEAIASYNEGKPLSSAQRNLLDAAALHDGINDTFSEDVSSASKIGHTVGFMAPFMAEMALNPAAGLSKATASTALKYGLKRYGKATMTKMAGKVALAGARTAGDVASSTILSTTLQAPRIVGDVYDRMDGQALGRTDENGYVKYAGSMGGVTAGTAIPQAVGAQVIENYTEMLGEHFGVLGKASRKGVATTLKKIRLDDVNEFVTNARKSDFAKAVSNFEKKTQYHGSVNEYLEEVIGGHMNAAMVGDQTFDTDKRTGVYNLEKNLETFAAVGLLGGAVSAVKTGGYLYEAGVERAYNKAEKECGKQFGDRWQGVQDELIKADNPAKCAIELYRDGRIENKEQYNAIVKYVGKLSTQRGYNIAREGRRTEGEVYQEQLDVEDAYTDGISETLPTEKNKHKHSFQLASDEMVRIWGLSSEEDIEPVIAEIGTEVSTILQTLKERGYDDTVLEATKNYLEAKARYNGVIDGVNEAINEAVENATEDISSRAHEDGNVYQGTLKVDNSAVSVINGDVKMLEDGSIDYQNSSQHITVKDADGNTKMIDARELMSISVQGEANSLIEEAAESIRQSEIERLGNEIEGSLPFNIGDKYPIVNQEKGEIGEITVDGINEDGSILITDNEGEQASMPPQEIENLVRQANAARAQYERASAAEAVQIIEDDRQEDVTDVAQSPEELEEQPPFDVDEKGNYLYHKREPMATVQFLVDENLDSEEMNAFIAANQKAAKTQLDRIKKKKPTIGTDIKAYKEAKSAWEEDFTEANTVVEHWNSVADIISGWDRDEKEEIIADVSKGLDLGESFTPMTKEEHVAWLLLIGKIKLQMRDYMKHTGYSIKEARQMLPIFRTKENGGVTIERAGEMIELDSSEDMYNFYEDNYDANQGLNALLDVLSNCKTIADLKAIITSRLEKEALDEYEHDRDQYDQWTQAQGFRDATEFEDYLDYINEVWVRNQPSEEAVKEIDSTFADEHLNKEGNGRKERSVKEDDGGVHTNAPAGIVSENEGGDSVLQGAQPSEQLREAENAGLDVNTEIDILPNEDGQPQAEVKPQRKRIVSEERYAELKKRMHDKLNNLNAGFDPELFAIGAEMAAYHIENGAISFVEFCKAMKQEFGDKLDGSLQAFYEGARRMPGMEELRKGMDSTEVVDNTDVSSITVEDAPTVEVSEKGESADKKADPKSEAPQRDDSEDAFSRAEAGREKEGKGDSVNLPDNKSVDITSIERGIMNSKESILAISEVIEGERSQSSAIEEIVKNLSSALIELNNAGKTNFSESDIERCVTQFRERVDSAINKKKAREPKIEDSKDDGFDSVIREDYRMRMETRLAREAMKDDSFMRLVYELAMARGGADQLKSINLKITGKLTTMAGIMYNDLSGRHAKMDALRGIVLSAREEIGKRLLKDMDKLKLEAEEYFKKGDHQGVSHSKAENGGKMAFVDAVKKDLTNGERLSILSLRKKAKEFGLEIPDTTIQEYTELAIIGRAKDICNSNISQDEKFAQIVDLYEKQPAISMRSSVRIMNQQYSTPVPISFIAGEFINAGRPNSVLEPSAGNGMMVFNIPSEKVTVNEIDPVRLENLKAQPFAKVTSQDALFGFRDNFDAIVMNPPFGSLAARNYSGYKIAGLDEQMVINALDGSLLPDGRAAIIIGGHSRYKENGLLASGKEFFDYLYDNYNVIDVVNIDGELYRKQGTTFPIRLILINGRRQDKTKQRIAPLKKDARADVVGDFNELYNRIKEEYYAKDVQGLLGDRVRDVGDNDKRVRDEGSSRSVDRQPNREHGGNSEIGGHGNARESGVPILDKQEDANRGDNAGGSNGRNAVPHEGRSDGESKQRSGGDIQGIEHSGAVRGAELDVREKSIEKAERKKIELTDETATYVPASNAVAIGSVIPSNMAVATESALSEIGDVDNYVLEKLGYGDLEELYQALAAEQIDGVALAIYQIEKGQSLIIGDMTGVGKGRQAAALIRYGVVQGKTPIFMTEKAGLFSDLYRDLVDIGSGDLVPFIVNDKGSGIDPTITDEKGNVIYKPQPKPVKDKVYSSRKLPADCKYVIATYSQFNGDYKSKGASPKQSFLMDIAGGNIVIFDESHNASGASNTGMFFTEVVSKASGAAFLSGTFAKRPENMPFYSPRSCISQANISSSELIEAVALGGVPLQEILSRGLTEQGQLIRRERNFEGVSVDWIPIEEHAEETRAKFDEQIELYNDIIRFEETYVEPYLDTLQKGIEASLPADIDRKGLKGLGVSNTPFASRMFNSVRQLLVSLKAKNVVEEVLLELKNGRKPVVAIDNTMEAFLKDAGSVGDVINTDFSVVIERALNSTLVYHEKTAFSSVSETKTINPNLLPLDGGTAYLNLLERIKNSNLGTTCSPIDYIKNEIEKAGYKVGEMTGRALCVEAAENGESKVAKRTETDKKELARLFNNGDVDALILNRSASTGISLHASSKFKDQRARVMIFAQSQLDVNQEVQMRGRIDRTGQVVRGSYKYLISPIPAEVRLTMMLKAKLKSLDANTTSNQKNKTNEIEMVDFLNKYGDQVVAEYLAEEPEMLSKLGVEAVLKNGEVEVKCEAGFAHSVTGRVALLSVSEQERFYSEVSSRYADYMNYLDSNGANDLEIKTIPLNAETKSSRVFVQGSGGDSVFSKDSILEEIEVDVLKKPMTIAEAKAEAISIMNADNTADHKRSFTDRIKQQKDTDIAEVEKAEDARVEKQKADFVELLDAKIEKSIAKGEILTNDDIEKMKTDAFSSIEEESENRKRSRIDVLTAKANVFKHIFNGIPIGRVIYVPTTAVVDGSTTFSYGMLLGFRSKSGKRITPSNVSAVFATLDGRRRFEVPLSKKEFFNGVIMQSRVMYGSDVTLENWDSSISNKTRQKRYIVTGNILQAYSSAKNGQLISYTTIEGQINQGILMPENFKDDLGLESPIKDSLSLLQREGVIESSNGEVTIRRNGTGFISIEVPKSNARGGKYFLDKDLLAFTTANNFTQKGNLMIGLVRESSTGDVLNTLWTKFKLKVKEGKDTAKDRRFRDGESVEGINNKLNKDKENSFRSAELEKNNKNSSSRENIKKSADELAYSLGTKVTYVNSSDYEGRKAKAKGWYDKATGEVVVVIDNATSIADVHATILHEIVGHKGLQELLGDKYDAFISRVFFTASPKVRKAIGELMVKNGWDYVEATEEYIARKAEGGFNRGFWAKVRSVFYDILSAAKIKFNAQLNDRDLSYMVRQSYNLKKNKGIIAEAENIAMEQHLKVGNFSTDEVSFRDGDSIDRIVGDVAHMEYERKVDSVLNRARETWQDSMMALKLAQDEMSKQSGRPILDHENAYLAENHMSSKGFAEFEFYKANFMKPMIEAVNLFCKPTRSYAGLSKRDFDIYLIAKHGLERNRTFSVRDAIFVDEDMSEDDKKALMDDYYSRVENAINGRDKSYDETLENELNTIAMDYTDEIRDYSGLTSIFGEEDNYTDIEVLAREFLNDVESDKDKVNALWNSINAATEASLKKSLDSSVMPIETYNHVSRMFSFYVPLRGWREDTASDVYDYEMSERTSFNPTVKTAKGRKSEADDPIATIVNMAQSAILQGNRNLMKLKFLNMVLNHPSTLCTVKEMWYAYNEAKGSWEQSLPNITSGMTPDEIKDEIDHHESRMRDLARDHKAQHGRFNLPFVTMPNEAKEHIVVVKRGGKEFTIFINGNPRLSQAVNGLTNPDHSNAGRLEKSVQWVNRQMSANFTSRNPAFIVANLCRDTTFAVPSAYIKGGARYGNKYVKNGAIVTSSIAGLLRKYKDNSLDHGREIEKHFYEFIQNGGETGYTNLENVEKQKEIIEKQIKNMNKKIHISALLDWFESANRCVEDINRFTAYHTSRQLGKSITQSISDAKEISVNFNKKGARNSTLSKFMSGAYLFFNPAIQGLANFMGMIKNHRSRTISFAAAYTVLGVSLPIINQILIESFGGDDDKDAYYNLPDYIRKNSFVIWSGNGNFIVVPLSIEWRAFFGLGEIIHSAASGKETWRNYGLEIASQFGELLPLNPIGDGEGSYAMKFVPDASKPIAESLFNQDRFGIPIYKDHDYNKSMPEFTKAYSGTSSFLIQSSELVNDLTGGNSYKSGSVDVNPAITQHLIETYFGGVGKSINQSVSSVSMIWNKDSRTTKNIPVVSRFFYESSDRNSFSRVNKSYWEYRRESDEVKQQLKGFSNDRKDGLDGAIEDYNRVANSPEGRRYSVYKSYEKKIKRLTDNLKGETDKAKIKQTQESINRVKESLVDKLDGIE